VVLAEDNPGDVFIISQALAHHSIDAELIRHKDGEEMLRYIRDLDAGEVPCPDVILLDLNLPRYNGEAILHRLRGSRFCSEVPVVIVTSSNADDDRTKVFRLGATRYFTKPIDLDDFLELGAVVLEVTGRKRPS
jgi:DNA-binding response OmpR family regulator